MSEIAGQSGLRGTATAVVHESYAFACMRCGHGWEQSYEIEHHTDADGHEFVQYVADGRGQGPPLAPVRSPAPVPPQGELIARGGPGMPLS